MIPLFRFATEFINIVPALCLYILRPVLIWLVWCVWTMNIISVSIQKVLTGVGHEFWWCDTCLLYMLRNAYYVVKNLQSTYVSPRQITTEPTHFWILPNPDHDSWFILDWMNLENKILLYFDLGSLNCFKNISWYIVKFGPNCDKLL